MQALDIIQECVTINHQIKKKSIKIKSSPVKYVGKYPRLHTPQADFIDDEDIATGSIKHSIIKPGTPQSKGKRGTCFEHLPPTLAVTLSSRPNTPSSPSGFEIGGDKGGGAVIPITPMGPTKGVSFKKLPVLKNTNSFTRFSSHSIDLDSVSSTSSVNTNDTDIEARRILKAVENEFKHWWKKYPLKRVEKDERGYLTDDITETYVIKRLDKLPNSTTTMSLRREIMSLVEDFESNGKLPYRISGDPKHQEEVKPVTNYAKEKARQEEEKRQQDELKRIQDEENRKLALIARKEKEKAMRKQQYETYLKGLKENR